MNGFVKGAFVIAAVAIPVIFFWHDLQTVFGNKALMETVAVDGHSSKNNEQMKKEKEEVDKAIDAASIKVMQQWKLPSALQEISGQDYIGNNEFACIQDEAGKIFIYNTASQKIEKEIPFADKGDYEGISVVGSTAYVIRSNGTLFEVAQFLEGKPSVQQFRTPLTKKQDVEGLCYDKNNNRLLLAIKGSDPNSSDYKGIYAFNLHSKQLDPAPVYKIDLMDKIWKEGKEKKAKALVQPSDLAVHPATGELYIVDGPKRKLLVMDAQGHPKTLYNLSKLGFRQPEGISFTPRGELYISSEGVNGAGVLARVEIEK